MSVVIDASVTMAWCFEDEAAPAADAALELLGSDHAIVPPLWQLEVANVLLTAEGRGRISEAQVERFTGLLAQLPIRVDTDVVEPAALAAVGRRHGLSAYDASYLLLAERHAAALATLDEALAAAAGAAGVEVLSGA